jgi:hypothetical protein
MANVESTDLAMGSRKEKKRKKKKKEERTLPAAAADFLADSESNCFGSLARHLGLSVN